MKIQKPCTTLVELLENITVERVQLEIDDLLNKTFQGNMLIQIKSEEKSH